MAITFCSLFSGSSGNATYIACGGVSVLIDAGLPGRTVCEALHTIHVLPETLSGILITHEHSDHIKGAGVLCRKYHLPIYANAGTWRVMESQIGQIPPSGRREFETGSDFYIGNMAIRPFAISHDAAEPVGYRIDYAGRSVAVATDIGFCGKALMEMLSGVDLLLLESNHDEAMLRANPHYTQALKNRILGRSGHMSNTRCGEVLAQLYSTGVRRVILGHLSGENNTPELARRTVCEVLVRNGIQPDADLTVDLAWRDRVGTVYSIN